MRYFIEPAVRTINYVAQRGYKAIVMAGLSGGGWTTDVVAAVDPRISLAVPIAASSPCDFLARRWDFEQQCHRPWAKIANYTALYVLGALEEGRAVVQVHHEQDRCCHHACNRHKRTHEYNEYVQAVAAGLFRTVVTNTSSHLLDKDDKALLLLLLARFRDSQKITAADLNSRNLLPPQAYPAEG
jgi:hypothetical protein